MPNRLVISPISIDLGSKNTGVYFAHYQAGSSLGEIEKEGKVYQLEKNAFTLMMPERTARRHQRRGYKRRQMVKRLFRLIWCQEFGLEWDVKTQQAIGFLFNRRGFSYLSEEYDAEALKYFPEPAFRELPEAVQNEFGEISDTCNLDEKMSEWRQRGQSEIERIFDTVIEKPKKTKSDLLIINRTNLLKESCKTRMGGSQIEVNKRTQNKYRLNKWILDVWDDMGIVGLQHIRDEGNTVDLAEKLNQQTSSVASEILSSLPADLEKQKAELNASIWNFDAEKFKLEKASFDPKETSNNSNRVNKRILQARKKWLRTHIHHFAFALHTVVQELSTGARHRSKYFQEIKVTLECVNHQHGYLNSFCARLQSGEFKIQNGTSLTPQSLANLIGHLSNLELKPLRKYFNDKRHKQGDYWDRSRLKDQFEHWILREWRVNPEKDLDKAPGAEYDYQKLRSIYKAHQGSVVDFWLKQSPLFTIPPYQDKNNRRPPKCQSLVLNTEFLDNNYRDWRAWLKELLLLSEVKEYLGNYKEEMEELKSSKDTGYFGGELINLPQRNSGRRTAKDLDARILQFLLDRVKDEDILKLNDIFSHTKKLRQQQSTRKDREKTREKLAKAMNCSRLPDNLKTRPNYDDSGVFAQGSFMHLICNYYKNRQKAREGRIFIHPEYRFVKGRGFENAGRFEDRDHLLTYCNHKPRQKRYQLISDIAGLFQISPRQLKKRTKSNDHTELTDWLKNIYGLKTNCADAASEQKNFRGQLKGKVREVWNESNSQDKLFRLVKKCVELCGEIGSRLYDEAQSEEWNQNLQDHPANAVFLLAQINNIAFKERRGNAKTCSVCSLDNAQRMQMFEKSVKAQRLPSIPTRLIDGAVMRLARILGAAIAKDKWLKIEKNLSSGIEVRIPIITESNRFEFEPDLQELKGRKADRSDLKEILSSKRKRIKESTQFSPYSGVELGNTGDIDHIIPRAHPKWGTLNDEANLIFTSEQDNRASKGDSEFSLSDLHPRYKRYVFGTADDSRIEKQIKDTIGDGQGGQFKFGRYFNFINLTKEQQRAFRHALFLKIGDPLRELVISTINHRTKSLVNGTQRYFAEVLANALYKKAKRIDKHHLLSFDYFGVEAQDNSRGDGIHNLRHDLVTYYRQDLDVYSKSGNSSQKPYSHLLDAQVAFCIIADAHRGSGGLRLELGNTGIWSRVNQMTGEREIMNSQVNDDSLFKAIQVEPKNFREISLERRKPDRQYFKHRSIHRDGMYAEHYLPILVHRKLSEVRIGFDWKNSFPLNDTKFNRRKLYFALQFNPKTESLVLTEEFSFERLRSKLMQIGIKSKENYFCISLNTQMIHFYYIEHFNTAKGYQDYSKGMRFLRDTLSYRTEKIQITTLDDAKKILNNQKNFKLSIDQGNLILPVKNEWPRLIDAWEKSSELKDGDFLRKYFRPKHQHPHKKIRQVYSLPIKSSGGHILLKRKSWNHTPIFQIVNDSNSQKIGAKAFIPACNSEGEICKFLSNSAKSRNTFFLKKEEYYSELSDTVRLIDTEKWHRVELSKSLEKIGVTVLEYRIEDNSRPRIRFKFDQKLAEKNIDKIFQDSLLKPRENKVKLEFKTKLNSSEFEFMEYKAKSFSKEIKSSLSKVLQQYYFGDSNVMQTLL